MHVLMWQCGRVCQVKPITFQPQEEALRILELYVQEGAEAVAKDLWGPEGAGKDARLQEPRFTVETVETAHGLDATLLQEVPRSKEEWAFRRIANGPDGYRHGARLDSSQCYTEQRAAIASAKPCPGD